MALPLAASPEIGWHPLFTVLFAVGVFALVFLTGTAFDALMRWGESNVPEMPEADDDL